MARSYTSAARKAAETRPAVEDPTGLLTWVGANRTRARQVLADLDGRPVPAGGEQDRQDLVEALLQVFPSFTLDGETFRVMGEMQLLDLCELVRLTKRRVSTTSPTAVVALADFFLGALGEAEYDRFRLFCREHAIDADVQNDVMEGIVEDLSEVPTSRPSHSVPGPSTSGPTSTVVSLSRRTVEQAPMSTEQFQDFLRRQEQEQQSPLAVVGTSTTPGSVSYG